MVRKLVCALFVMTIGIGFVVADEATGLITKIDGNKFTFQKTKKGKSDGDAVVMTLAKDAKIVKGKFNADTKKVEPGDPLPDGLKNEVFAKGGDKGVAASVTFDGTTASQIVVGGKMKKKAAE